MPWTVRHFSGGQHRCCFCDVTQQWKTKGLGSHSREKMQGRKPQELPCSKVLSVPAEIHWDQPLGVSRWTLPFLGCHGGAYPDLTAFLLKPKASLHQIIVTKKWKCATGWQCFAVFSPAHWWRYFNHLTGWLRIINLPKWIALFILLFQPIAYYFIWIKIWIFTALRVFLIFLQSEATCVSQASPYHTPGSAFPNVSRSGKNQEGLVCYGI